MGGNITKLVGRKKALRTTCQVKEGKARERQEKREARERKGKERDKKGKKKGAFFISITRRKKIYKSYTDAFTAACCLK